MDRQAPHLPTDIIEHIQSFMDAKAAAICATHCKQLYRAWRTNKKLDFDQRAFRRANQFWTFATDTLQRYEYSKIRIETFILRVTSGFELYFQAKQLILRAAKLGAVEVTIELLNDDMFFNLPPEIFSTEKLQKLYVSGGTMNVRNKAPQVVTCNLKTLELYPQRFIGRRGDVFENYVMRCPSLERLVCRGCLLSFDPNRFGPLGNGFHNLSSLTLYDLRYRSSSFFTQLVRRFPRLKSLSICHAFKCHCFRICSESLEFISICEPYRPVIAKLNVPNLTRFKFEGVAWSRLTFERHAPNWRSDVRIICFRCSDYWFSSFRTLLLSLKCGKVFLTIDSKLDEPCLTCPYKRKGERIPVETIDIRSSVPIPGIVLGILRICMPIRDFVNGNAARSPCAHNLV